MSVKIRFRKVTRKTPNENYSIYLDIYHDGKRKYDYPKIYVSENYSKTKRIKSIDKQKMALVQAIKAKTEIAIKEDEYGFKSKKHQQKDFIAYYKKIARQKNHRNYYTGLKKLEEFMAKKGYSKLSFNDFTNDFIRSLRVYFKVSEGKANLLKKINYGEERFHKNSRGKVA